MTNFLNQKPYVVFLAVLTGSMTGAIIMLYGGTSSTLAVNSYLVLWFFINIVTFSLYVIVGVLLWTTAIKYKHYFRKDMLISAILILALVLLPDSIAIIFSSYITNIIAYLKIKIFIIIFAGILSIGIPAFFTIWTIQIVLQENFPTIRINDLSLNSYIRLRNELTSATLALGFMIGLLTLAAASLRKANLAAKIIGNSDYPIEIVLVYGLYFTTLLMLVYVPVFLSMNAIGHRICNHLFPLPPTNSDRWLSQISKRDKCQELLQLKLNPLQNWPSELAILAPLLSSIIAALLEK